MLLGALMFGATAANATVMEALTIEALVERSDVVAIVQVESVETRRTRGRLWRRVQALVHEPLAGVRPGARLVVTIPGGEDDDYIQYVPGAPDPLPGELAIVFLTAYGAGAYSVVGLYQGWLVVTHDPSDPTRQIVTQTVDAHLLGKQPTSNEQEPTGPTTRPFAPLLERVRRAVESR